MLHSSELIEKVKSTPEEIDFTDTMATIDNEYQFQAASFQNGEQKNEAGQNNGSCKIFTFAKLHSLDATDTLQLFGDFYRVDVLQNPEGEDHQNIRQFMIHGWDGVNFESISLTPKA
ncbi:type III effector [Marinomonas sp. S3726]|uniref:HopJ type III effector protein n=1 Tax=Marinomonas sp. S3726 TaxID=579484 RepID=UPI0005FA45FF|nr:HopJ type III effector protein [Marinomonas sp. S3726]KJZ14284.1 type III effector [Marinomonas sp. S3726]